MHSERKKKRGRRKKRGEWGVGWEAEWVGVGDRRRREKRRVIGEEEGRKDIDIYNGKHT